MRISLITILLISCIDAYAQQTIISTGKIPLGIRVRKAEFAMSGDVSKSFHSDGPYSEEFYDLSTLCDGLDIDGLPINLILPESAQIILFLPAYNRQSEEILVYNNNDSNHTIIQNFNYVYQNDSVGLIGGIIQSSGSSYTIHIKKLISHSSDETSIEFTYKADQPEIYINEIYLIEQIEQFHIELSQGLFVKGSRDYSEWLEKQYTSDLDEHGIPVNPEFPHYIDNIVFSVNTYSQMEIKIYGGRSGERELQPVNTGSNIYNISNLSPGNYFIRIENREKKYGEKSITYPFSIKNSFWYEGGYWLAIFTPLLIILFFIYRTYTKIKINRLQLNKQLSEAELKAIRAQLNPHFLFNALNAIQNLVNKQDTENANTYIAKLSKLMRKVLAQSDDTMHELTEEIEISRLYLELEKMRSPFDYEIEIAPEVSQNMLLPSMILQPYLENAVIHGIVHGGGSHITLHISNEDHYCVLEICDDGKGSTKTTGNGKGLKLGKERLDIIDRQTDDSLKTSVSMTQLPEGGYCVSIKLPKDL